MSAFPITRWTLIVAAGESAAAAADDALTELCRAYWYPVYAFIRRSGSSPDAAEDLTQGFFARFLERRNYLYADRAKGRFRSFLLTSVKQFLADESERAQAAKRGGKGGAFPLDLEDAELRYARQFAHQETPERLYEREWTQTLLRRVGEDVRVALEREGHAEQFARLKRFLPGSEETASYADAAMEWGMSEGAVKVAAHRLRRRYRDAFRAEVANLVADEAAVDDEVRRLLETLRS